jgi:hypothetical protein
MFVALLGPTKNSDQDASLSNPLLDVIDLPDPSSRTIRPYLVHRSSSTSSGILCEIGCAKSPLTLDDSYQSFAVGGQFIVKNGTLHTITRIDPLFWFLDDEHLTSVVRENGTKADGSARQQQWQPLSQILSECNPLLVCCLKGRDGNDATQLQHLYAEMSLDGGGDDDTYVKFSVEKALRWLEMKYQVIEPILHRQLENEQRRAASVRGANGTGGAFLSGFTIASTNEDDYKRNQVELATTNGPWKRDQLNPELQQRAKEASIQIVCNYLTPSWRQRFLQHLQLESSEVLESSFSLKPRSSVKRQKQQTSDAESSMPKPKLLPSDWNDAVSAADTEAANRLVSKTKMACQPITAGAKKLLKANKRGLQKMSSFFGVSNKPK